MNERPDWDTYFMDIAKVVSTRSTCLRASVGAVIVKDNRILATGYNGSIPGDHHCSDVGCQMWEGHCVRTVHGETNALLDAARRGHAVDGASIYIYKDRGSPNPCFRCQKHMRMAGIASVYTREDV